MALESIIVCPVCKANHFNPYTQCIDYTTTNETFTIIQCTTCQLLITSPRPDANSIGSYYESDSYISHTNNSKNLSDNAYRIIRTFTLRWKLKIIRNQKPTGKILDYGCGTGDFLNQCKQSNWECYGVEPAEPARRKATQLTTLDISDSLLKLNNKKFDVITLWHVLEHVHNLNEKLSELKSHLAKDGILFIAVPNHECLDAKIYKTHWAAYDVPRHLWHFSQHNMKMLLALHGLNLIDTIPMKQDSFYVSVLSEKYKNPTANFLTNIVRALIIGLRSNFAARKTNNYSSLVFIAKP